MTNIRNRNAHFHIPRARLAPATRARMADQILSFANREVTSETTPQAGVEQTIPRPTLIPTHVLPSVQSYSRQDAAEPLSENPNQAATADIPVKTDQEWKNEYGVIRKETLDKKAKIIQQAFRKHREKVKEQKLNDMLVKPLTYFREATNDQPAMQKVFFFDSENQYLVQTPEYDPNNISLASEFDAEGSSKKMLAASDKYVWLQSKLDDQNRPSIEKGRQINAKNMYLAKKYSSFTPTFRVGDKDFVAKNAGSSLEQLRVKNQTINIASFKNVLQDINAMHYDNTYHLDLSPLNFVYNKQKVGLIDGDDVLVNINPNFMSVNTNFAISGRTDINLMNALFYAKQTQNYPAFCSFALSIDNYNCLLSMMGATTGSQDVIFPNESKLFHYKNWIDIYIKPEYKKEVLSFLYQPASFRLSKPLIEIVNFSATEPRIKPFSPQSNYLTLQPNEILFLAGKKNPHIPHKYNYRKMIAFLKHNPTQEAKTALAQLKSDPNNKQKKFMLFHDPLTNKMLGIASVVKDKSNLPRGISALDVDFPFINKNIANTKKISGMLSIIKDHSRGKYNHISTTNPTLFANYENRFYPSGWKHYALI